MRFQELALAAGSASVASAQFLFVGTNQAGAEFGEMNLPGRLDKDYTWPSTDSIDTLMGHGMNTFRINFKMERFVPDTLGGAVNETYAAGLDSTVAHVTGAGAYAVIDPHNYGRYYDEIIEDVEGFGAWWTTLADRFKDNDMVIFDTNNEYHEMDQDLVKSLNQAAIDAIRAAGATSQYIFVEGNAWTGAHSWVSSGNAASLVDLSDPEDKIVYEMHQYLDSDSSGTSEECVSATIGSERLQEATQWLKDNGKKGFLGEMGVAVNDVCIEAVTGALTTLQENSDVWVGWTWWAAGPWWADYMYSLEPPTGPAYVGLMDTLEPFITVA